ncbi:MAG: ABC transporter substrate-binding protein [Pseudomonadota bacterium]
MKHLAAAAFGLLAAMPALAGEFPKTVTDGRGAEVTLPASPERIAALWIGAADLLVALGRPVAGVTTYESEMPVYLGEAMEGAIDLGDITAPNLELMAVSDFDLTVGMTRYNAPYAEDIEKFSPFLSYEGINIAQSLQTVSALGTAIGAEAETEAMNAKFLTLIDEMAAKAPEEPREALFVWSFQNTLYGYKDNLMTAELVSSTGAVNPLGRVEGELTADNAFAVLEAEDLLELDPDVILMFVSHGGPAAFQPAYERLQAYQSDQIYSVGYQYSQPAGPIARALVLLEAAHLIYPEIYDAPDMPEAARAKPLEFAR